MTLSFCLRSGESGSGKTEACKHIVRHLTARSSPKGFALEPRMKHVSPGGHRVGRPGVCYRKGTQETLHSYPFEIMLFIVDILL